MTADSDAEPTDEPVTPVSQLGLLAIQEKEIAPGLRHLELYTTSGLLSLLWHGDPAAERVVLTFGGAMGSLLGPADGLYHDLGVTFAEAGIGTIRVGYRTPNHLSRCIHDVAAATEIAASRGGERFVVVGHSFGGAVAVGVAAALPEPICGVVTLSTQAAGMEPATRLDGRPLLLLHGDRDELLPAACSEAVRSLAGGGELVILPGAGHLLREAGEEIRRRLGEWIPAILAG